MQSATKQGRPKLPGLRHFWRKIGNNIWRCEGDPKKNRNFSSTNNGSNFHVQPLKSVIRSYKESLSQISTSWHTIYFVALVCDCDQKALLHLFFFFFIKVRLIIALYFSNRRCFSTCPSSNFASHCLTHWLPDFLYTGRRVAILLEFKIKSFISSVVHWILLGFLQSSSRSGNWIL